MLDNKIGRYYHDFNETAHFSNLRQVPNINLNISLYIHYLSHFHNFNHTALTDLLFLILSLIYFDRFFSPITDCVATTKTRSRSCGCGEKCECSRNSNSRCRYVSPTLEEAFRRSLQTRPHPNRVYKRQKRRPVPALAWAAIIKPVKELTPVGESLPQLKSRRRRDLSKFFGFKRKSQSEKRPERLVKQYNKRLPIDDNAVEKTTPTAVPKIEQNFKTFNAFPKLPSGKGPFAKFREVFLAHSLRNKRDIKGEYDLLEREREQLDLTLPEIIQFMPERGQCQFANCRRHRQQLQEQMDREDLLQRFESNKVSTETTDGLGDSMNIEASGDHSDDDNGSDDNSDNTSNDDNSDNEIHSASSTHRKRNAVNYGCSNFQHFSSPTPPSDGFYIQSYDSGSDVIPRSFAVANNPYGPDPTPQQYEGAAPVYPISYSYPGRSYVMTRSLDDDVQVMEEPIYNNQPFARGGHYPNSQLDQVIADIVSQHVAFIESSAGGRGGTLVDPPVLQDHETKSFLKLLAEGRFHKLFGDEDRTYTFAPLDYPHLPPLYSSSSIH